MVDQVGIEPSAFDTMELNQALDMIRYRHRRRSGCMIGHSGFDAVHIEDKIELALLRLYVLVLSNS
jgi:hypothetical protein